MQFPLGNSAASRRKYVSEYICEVLQFPLGNSPEELFKNAAGLEAACNSHWEILNAGAAQSTTRVLFLLAIPIGKFRTSTPPRTGPRKKSCNSHWEIQEIQCVFRTPADLWLAIPIGKFFTMDNKRRRECSLQFPLGNSDGKLNMVAFLNAILQFPLGNSSMEPHDRPTRRHPACNSHWEIHGNGYRGPRQARGSLAIPIGKFYSEGYRNGYVDAVPRNSHWEIPAPAMGRGARRVPPCNSHWEIRLVGAASHVVRLLAIPIGKFIRSALAPRHSRASPLQFPLGNSHSFSSIFITPPF